MLNHCMFSNMQLGRWQQRLLSSDGLSLLEQLPHD